MEVDAAAAAPAPVDVQEELNIASALQIVLRKSLANNGLRRGLHECVRALDRGTGRLAVLAADCDNQEYVKLVQALCKESNVPIVMVDKRTDIGEWVKLAKYNADNTVRKAVKVSVAVVEDFGDDSAALQFVRKFVAQQA